MSSKEYERLTFIANQIRQQVSIRQVVERYTDRRIVKGAYNCPLHNEFRSEVDREKYPGIKQKYRLEKVGDFNNGFAITESNVSW